MADDVIDLADSIQKGHEIEKARKQRVNDELAKLQTERDAAINEVKAPLVAFLDLNAKGAFDRQELEKLDVNSLKLLKEVFTDSVETGYAVILAERERKRKEDAKAKWGSDGPGVYDPNTRKWKGGTLGDE
jgi:hypothetical protein